jgi:glutamate-1-semialdehyde aminotransferase
VTPDLASFGKAMANGMPISAIVGKREIMKLMDDIFFSGTFGGEALSLAASIATITKLEKIDAPKIIQCTGRTIRDAVQSKITYFELDEILSLVGTDWWPRIVVRGYRQNSQIELSSLLRQEFIEQGIFIGGGFNLSIAHNDETIISETLSGIHQALERFSTYLNTDNPMSNLRGELIKSVFQVR